MENIWKDGIVVTDGKGNSVHIDPQALDKVLLKIKADNGKNIVAVYTEREFSEEQYIKVYEKLEDILECDSGDAEYRACKDILGNDFDIVWKMTCLLNGEKCYDFSFLSFKEAWKCAMDDAISASLNYGENCQINVSRNDGRTALITIVSDEVKKSYEITMEK